MEREVRGFCMTQFEIECRCGGHSVTKKFKTILQKSVAPVFTRWYFNIFFDVYF